MEKRFSIILFALVLLISGVFAVPDSVGATTISGFSQIGSNVYGTGTIVGGLVVDGNTDLNTSTCQYTQDGTTWVTAAWSSDHCQKTSFAIEGAKNYTFNTRIRKELGGAYVTGTALTVHGAMLVSDTGNAIFDVFGGLLYGLSSSTGNLILVIILIIIVVVVVDALTGRFGIFEILKRRK